MQYYPIVGDWERSNDQGRRLSMVSRAEDGSRGKTFASGKITKTETFRATEDGLWGTTPGSDAVVDVWGDGINKLATLAVTNQSTYNSLFG